LSTGSARIRRCSRALYYQPRVLHLWVRLREPSPVPIAAIGTSVLVN
jgi:hypothetical protein